MKLRVLGCSGAEFPGFRPPAYLLDDVLLLDAGTIGAVLEEEEQRAIRDILVTHAHLDHIRGIPLLADNLVTQHPQRHVTVAATRETLASIRGHLMNDVLWPDFSRIPSERDPVIRYREIVPGSEVRFDGYAVTAHSVHHTVPAVGYVVRRGGKSLLYTGDTGPTDRIWEAADGVTAMIVEVSFPNAMEELARVAGHLTPRLLAGELAKVRKLPSKIFVVHPKPQHRESLAAELSGISVPGLSLLHDGEIHRL